MDRFFKYMKWLICILSVVLVFCLVSFFRGDNIRLNYIPDGFELIKDSSTKTKISLHYENGEQYFSFSTNDITENISIDTEDAVIEKLTINNCEAILSLKKNANILLWHNSKRIFKIMGSVSKEEMIKMAENTIIE